MKSSLQFSSKRLFFLKLLTPLLFTAGLIGLGALSHCTKTDNPVDPGSGGDACANACTASQVCSQGTCKTACDSGLTTCGSSCVDTTQDAAHCGACGNVCTANQVCTAGSCTFQIPEAQIQTTAVSRVDRPEDMVTGAMSVQRTAQDSQGNVYITGDFKGTVTVGDKTISCQNSSQDVFVTKIGLNGQVIWAKSFKNQGNDKSSSTAIAADAQGNVYVGGYFTGVVQFDGVPLTSTLNAGPPPNYSREAFLTKLDANGAVVWAFKYGGGNDSGTTVEAITVDQQGSVIAVVKYRDSSLKQTLAIIQYAASTTQMNPAERWRSKWAITEHFFDPATLVTDAAGNILILLKAFQGSIGTGSSNSKFATIESAKDGNGKFIPSNGLVKLAQGTGAIQWVSLLPYDSQVLINLLMSQGSLVVMDGFAQDLDFGTDSKGNSIKIPKPSSGSGIYWSTWDLTTGQPITAYALEGSGVRQLSATSVDSQGNVYMMSVFSFSKASYGSTVLQPVSEENVALVKLDAAGKPLWAERINDALVPSPGVFSLVLDAQNSPWLFLYLNEPTSIGGTQLTPKGNLFDFGFAKLKP